MTPHGAGGIAPTLMTARVASLSACFPVYDEEDNVVPMAESVLAMLPEVADAWELIIVLRRADDFRRRVAGVVWTFVVRVVLGVRVRDVNCAFKVLRRDALAGIALESEGASISAELLAHLAARDQRVVELPVDHYPRVHGQASGNALHVVARAGPELWRVRRNVRALRRAR